jgi:hypothetical protein
MKKEVNMTNLRCGVTNCVYNNDALCDKSVIKVSGDHADTPKETCCSSFHDSKGSTRNKSAGMATLETIIACSAKNCSYNEHEKCNARSIEVAGRGASDSEETLCSTFHED